MTRPLPTLGILGAACLLIACGGEAGPGAGGFLELHLLASGGSPAAWRVVAAGSDVHAVTCGAGSEPEATTDGPLSCTPRGARLARDAATGGVDLTVKVPGARTVLRRVLPAELEAGSASIPLEPLPPFEHADDYSTGLAADDGLERFRELAQTIDTDVGPAEVVKFYLRGLDGVPELYLMHTRRHPLHYGFVHGVLGEPMTEAEYEERTLHGEDRAALAGSLVRYPDLEVASAALAGPARAPVALTFFPSDDLSPALARAAHTLLEERMLPVARQGGVGRLAYLPAGERQEGELLGSAEPFVRRDAPWLLREEVYGQPGLQVLNPGLAYGMLSLVTPEDLETRVFSFSDVLVLTRLPTDLPVVGGTITCEPQTPLAHVNVAARGRGTPNIALPGADRDPGVAGRFGRMVRFEVRKGGYTLAPATHEEAQAFWDSRRPEPFSPPADLELDGLPGFDELGFSDSPAVGVKAANLAELRGLLPEQVPDGFAVPFSHYDRFVRSAEVTPASCDQAEDDCLEERRSAEVCGGARALCEPPGGDRETIQDQAARVVKAPGFLADSALREAVLDALAHHIGHADLDAGLAQALDERVRGLVGDGTARLRSSTNAEDLPNFSGAGLYRSVSAEADGDRPASERIRKVWASVWSFAAFEERSFWGIDHLAIRMGVAVHRAFPEEQANGVLITRNLADPTVAGMYVNVQLGETSVTYPEDGAVPEVFSIVPAPDGVQVARQRYSSLAPGEPLLTAAEVVALYKAAARIQMHFAPLYRASPAALALDLEFKLHGAERALVVKQVRPYAGGDGR